MPKILDKKQLSDDVFRMTVEAPLIAEEAEEIDDIDVNLTLEGLRIIYERNNS